MSIIASLDINLRGNTSSIDKAADSTANRIGALRQSVDTHATAINSRFSSLGKTVSASLTGLASVASLAVTGVGALATAVVGLGAGFVGMGKHAMEGVAKLAESAQKIGISTEALAGLQHAAKLAGADADLLDSSLVKMQRNLSEAAQGGGSAAKALGQLGLNASDLVNLSADQSLFRIADALNNVGGQSDRVALAMDIFGKSGAGMLNMMSEGSKGLQAAIKEAGDIGLSVTAQQAAQVKQADDAWKTMKEAVLGFGRTASIVIAPFVKMFAEGMTSAMKWVASFRDDLINFGLKAEFVFRNFSDYADLYLQKSALAVVSFFNTTEHLIREALPAVFKEAMESVTANIDHGLDVALVKVAEFVQQYSDIVGKIPGFSIFKTEGLTEALRQQADISGKKLDRMANIADRMSGITNRAEGAFEKNLRESVERLRADIDRRQADFLEKRKADLGIKRTGEGEALGPAGRSNNAAVEKGSQEALKILANTQGDKYLKTANDQLAEARKTNKLLDKLLNKAAGRIAIAKGKV